MNTNQRLALLIDGDNAQALLLPQVLAAISPYGTLAIRRVYGDWTEANMKSWKEIIHTHALQPVQQFRYTNSKNATDSALIIDAMDILHTAEIDGFCIASSDSDYTRLAMRIREGNRFVLGVGRQNTPQAFVNACNVFIHTEKLEIAGSRPQTTPLTVVSKQTTPKSASFEGLFRAAFQNVVQEDGWAHLSALGDSLRKIDPQFDPRNYGHKLLSQLVLAHPAIIEVRTQKNPTGNAVVYIRQKGVKRAN